MRSSPARYRAGVTTGFGYVWVANGGDNTVTRIDPALAAPAGPPDRRRQEPRRHRRRQGRCLDRRRRRLDRDEDQALTDRAPPWPSALQVPRRDHPAAQGQLGEADALLILWQVADFEGLEQGAEVRLHRVDAEKDLVRDLLVGRRARELAPSRNGRQSATSTRR